MAAVDEKKQDHESGEYVPLRFHPRVFAALGSDLVTNDLVAITELVKNAYDAFASRVDVRFTHRDDDGLILEIEDDGLGMDRKTIEDVWAVVATPHREKAPTSRRRGSTRRTSGEKGLGRLSVARLGEELEMYTKATRKPCYRVTAPWPKISESESLADCRIHLSETSDCPISGSGTLLRITKLNSEWGDDEFDNLYEHLSRMVSPFSEAEDFEICLHRLGGDEATAAIRTPEFLSNPKYSLTGSFSTDGLLDCEYRYQSTGKKKVDRTTEVSLTWEEIREKSKSQDVSKSEMPTCGPFTIELRVWDIGAKDVAEISELHDLKKSFVRAAIRAHKGISVYRDDILVLPKTEGARDWLGLDLRRVSEVGTRISTSQMIGYVAIGADTNPLIRDTSDRERLVDSLSAKQFMDAIRAAVGVLEREREKDRLDQRKAREPLKDLLGGLSATELIEGVEKAAREGASASDAAPLVARFGKKLDSAREEIERRFVYYSRLATIGTLATMLVHEVRNKTTVLEALLRVLEAEDIHDTLPTSVARKVELARSSLQGLDDLAKTFAPLASRSFSSKRRTSFLEQSIEDVLEMLGPEIKRKKIEVEFRQSGSTELSVDPAELDAVLFNIIGNAVYWLGRVPKHERQLKIRTRRLTGGQRIRVGIHDSGPGVDPQDEERIFWPGVTNKPEGIGMGLTIAGEIVDGYDGKLELSLPGLLGGASFEFDVPITT